jgi:hypothetical protein
VSSDLGRGCSRVLGVGLVEVGGWDSVLDFGWEGIVGVFSAGEFICGPEVSGRRSLGMSL